MKRTNLIIIQTDQQAQWTVSAYQDQSQLLTPEIDSIVRNGFLCSTFFANCNPCTPSRGTFLTGLYPHSHGATRNNHPISQNKKTFAHALKQNGYETHYIGKYHLDGNRRPGWVHPSRRMGFANNLLMFNRGHFKEVHEINYKKNQFTQYDQPNMFESIGDESSYMTDWLTNQAINVLKRKRNKPLCLMISYPDPHPPYKTREPYQSMYATEEIKLPETFRKSHDSLREWLKDGEAHPINDENVFKQKKASYLGMVKLIDRNIGKLLHQLKASGELENTLIVFTSDHGDYMGEHGLMGKTGMHECAYKVPLLISFPAKISGTKNIDFLWSTIDFAPTILDLLEIDTGIKFEGKSYAEELFSATKLDNFVYIEDSSTDPQNHGRVGIATDSYWYAINSEGAELLYDRKKDTSQSTDLSQCELLKNKKAKLLEALTNHHEELKSPHREWLDKLSKNTAESSLI